MTALKPVSEFPQINKKNAIAKVSYGNQISERISVCKHLYCNEILIKSCHKNSSTLRVVG